MSIKQLSVFVENKLGRLAEVTTALHENNIDIRALSIADTTNFGILRLIVDHPSNAETALKSAGFTVSQTDVIAISVVDQPGGLAKALTTLTNAGVGVEYMYAFISRDDRTANVIIRVEDNHKAAQVLEAAGIPMMSADQIYDM